MNTRSMKRIYYAELVEKYKAIYDREVEEKSKEKQWDPKRKRFVTPSVQWGYLTRAVIQ